MTITPWKILESTNLHPRLRIDKCELSNGKFLDATVFEFGSWANVFAITKNNEVVLIRQYRHGVREVLWEIPGGAVDEGEDPMEGVKRELLEETGYTAPDFVQIGKLYPNPAIQGNSMYYFLAMNSEKVDGQSLDWGEEIDVKLVPLDELIEMARRGKLMHALQVAGLFCVLDYLDRIK